VKIISYGGGVQSTALCVLATQGKLGQIDAAVFANVGDDSEHPRSLAYVRDVMQPWAKEHGLPVHEISRVMRNGKTETLWQQLMKPESRSINIPVRMIDTGAPGNRNCTSTFKIKVITRWLKKHGVSVDSPATVCIGFSTDEAHRVSNRTKSKYELPVYPLLDLRLSRQDCKNLIARAGLPVPPKSSCFFCPFHRPDMWSRMRRDEPELFQKSVELERALNERRRTLNRDEVFLTRFGKPLDEVIEARQTDLPFESPDTDSCDEGHCWT